MRKILPFLVVIFLTAYIFITQPKLPKQINQKIDRKPVAVSIRSSSVMILDNMVCGSGVIHKRDGVYYVWTVAHLLEPNYHTELRGLHLTKVFDVPEIKIFDPKTQLSIKTWQTDVLAYDADSDIALLRVKGSLPSDSANFYLNTEIPDIGTPLYQCGNLRGFEGIFTISDGIVAFIDRDMPLGIFDQSTCLTNSGGSGGGVFLQSNGEIVGLLDAKFGDPGEYSNVSYFIPVRRIQSWAKKNHFDFALDDSVPVPVKITPLPED